MRVVTKRDCTLHFTVSVVLQRLYHQERVGKIPVLAKEYTFYGNNVKEI